MPCYRPPVARNYHRETLYRISELLKALADSLPEQPPAPRLKPAAHPTLETHDAAFFQRRGQAIAQGKTGGDRLLKAIANSKWRSQDNYARSRLGISPQSLVAYRKGITPCRMSVADMVQKDFGISHNYWPSLVDDLTP